MAVDANVLLGEGEQRAMNLQKGLMSRPHSSMMAGLRLMNCNKGQPVL